MLWRNNTGYDHEKKARYGLVIGGSDCIGMWLGLFLAVECKGTGGRLTAEQMRFLQLVYERGGVAVAVGPNEWEQALGRVRAGERRVGW